MKETEESNLAQNPSLKRRTSLSFISAFSACLGPVQFLHTRILLPIREHIEKITFDINEEKDFGDIVQVKIKNDKAEWFCKFVEVKSPSGKSFKFPCYRWIEKKEVAIREGSARLPQDDTLVFKKESDEERESKKDTFRWIESNEHFSQDLHTKREELPLDVQFDEDKTSHFDQSLRNVKWNTVKEWGKYLFQPWNKIEHFEQILADWNSETTLLVNVKEDWDTDYMFGYQFLNGCNPVMIRKCVELPKTFPVTYEMVKGSLQRGFTLEQELEKGNIYIADYEILDGLEPNKKHQNNPYFLTAPICLLYNNKMDQIVPIAIQLSQKPGKRSPIFLPNDNEHDWRLAKMWVKSSDFNVHQLVTHLLKTHLISEMFELAMYRQLSPVHPVYKLLIPHVRFTIAINTQAREKLNSEDGVFSKISSISADGIEELMKRAMKTFTYKSMCFPEAINARGMENTPKYYYRDDGMKIWEAIYSFVDQVIKIYYDSDEKVKADVATQHFVKNVNYGMENFLSGMKDPEGKKFPLSLKTREELVKYLTAIIFNASAQHAAVNFGQFEWYGWIPNSPSTMRQPPLQEKGTVDPKPIMNTLPDRGCSFEVLRTVWLLTQFQDKERCLGMYPDEHFTEQPVKEAILTFRNKLDELTDIIKRRNKGLTMSYCYLSPHQIPNSVAI
ncbi:polyunsaturated fatty acid 5-lipoxygenase-like [Triplophysa dalaica]|uniref:polyunsaturated fatty acid 5-lipoxygenase-like n=1 Tax=Triplophysa dalaica TaxID=1582913 RepID=UPI0024E03E56|nr:polyunsaturated fatty acid 5-lipoxygenase-like [Triplophysa dalaica]